MERQNGKDYSEIPGSYREQWEQIKRLILSGIKQGAKEKACTDLRFLHDTMITENKVGDDDTVGNLGTALNLYERQIVKQLAHLNEQKPRWFARSKWNKQQQALDRLRRVCHNAALVMIGINIPPVTDQNLPGAMAIQSPIKTDEVKTLLFPHGIKDTEVPTHGDILDYVAERVEYFRRMQNNVVSNSEQKSLTTPIQNPAIPTRSSLLYPDLGSLTTQPPPPYTLPDDSANKLQMMVADTSDTEGEEAAISVGNYRMVGTVALSPLRGVPTPKKRLNVKQKQVSSPLDRMDSAHTTRRPSSNTDQEGVSPSRDSRPLDKELTSEKLTSLLTNLTDNHSGATQADTTYTTDLLDEREIRERRCYEQQIQDRRMEEDRRQEQSGYEGSLEDIEKGERCDPFQNRSRQTYTSNYPGVEGGASGHESGEETANHRSDRKIAGHKRDRETASHETGGFYNGAGGQGRKDSSQEEEDSRRARCKVKQISLTGTISELVEVDQVLSMPRNRLRSHHTAEDPTKHAFMYPVLQAPLVAAQNGKTAYHPFTLGDIHALIDKMPLPTEGGRHWMRRFADMAVGQTICLGDFRRILAQQTSYYEVERVEDRSGTSTMKDDVPISFDDVNI
ncbi:uncharacterized protein LOC117536325 [Gymnodraco acuticeps]|uniref:Uncharacterized protein LOC117536325 n=1 Tax=Gymnodraco acuticeps TaxID=8218 RepID=A0A6P8T0P8_GYMAC|nr:uncharacterized protein LOC117536325 [Gymnodraco acuticeps]